jgi:hypothetical protein
MMTLRSTVASDNCSTDTWLVAAADGREYGPGGSHCTGAVVAAVDAPELRASCTWRDGAMEEEHADI